MEDLRWGEEEGIEGKLVVNQRKSNASQAIKVYSNKKICGQNCHLGNKKIPSYLATYLNYFLVCKRAIMSFWERQKVFWVGKFKGKEVWQEIFIKFKKVFFESQTLYFAVFMVFDPFVWKGDDSKIKSRPNLSFFLFHVKLRKEVNFLIQKGTKTRFEIC